MTHKEIATVALTALMERRAALDTQIAAIREIVDDGAAPKAPKAKARRFSPEGLERIAAATKARWAKVHAEQAAATEAPAPAPAKKRTISAKGRANMRKAQRARWKQKEIK